VFVKGVLRAMFQPRADKVTRRWRKLLTWSFVTSTFSSLIRMTMSVKVRWAGNVARVEFNNNACRLFVEMPGEMIPFGRPSCT
jgi:hypothetical protein